MARYIDAEQVRMAKVPYDDELTEYDRGWNDACEAIADNAETADVRENVHANWVGIDDFPHETFECNHCGHIEEVNDVRFLSKFCPNCGADMRERRDDG